MNEIIQLYKSVCSAMFSCINQGIKLRNHTLQFDGVFYSVQIVHLLSSAKKLQLPECYNWKEIV